jgi:aminobenzoyl-glutamate utilization protein B
LRWAKRPGILRETAGDRFAMTRSFLLLAAALAPFAAGAQTAPTTGADILAKFSPDDAQISRVSRALWDYAELGYLETRSSELLQSELRAAGFTVVSGVAGIPTAFTASWGSGGPVIGILAEFDALPGINQDANPERAPIEGKNAGHACGHNLFGAGSMGAAISIKKWLEETKTPGVIRLYGTPAEEGGSGKVYMVRAGLFKDVDVALHWHPDDKNTAAAETTLANRSAKFRFTGVSAHAAAAPEHGRSALDGAEAFNMMVNMMREHVPQDARIHYVITKGGSAPNVVPDGAEVFYYVRHPSAEGLKEIWARVENAARGAAMGTGTKVEWEVIHGSHPLLVNETLAKMVDGKLREVGGLTYTKEEEVFAKRLYASFDKPDGKLGDEKTIKPYEKTMSYGSTDVGDVSMAVPTVGFSTAAWVPGTSAHSWQSTAAGGMSIGFRGAQNAARVLTLSAIELYQNPALRAEARKEFDAARGPKFKYEALLGNRQPPLDYRK